MTKIDVLNIFTEIAAATHYQYNGKTTDHLPFDLCQTEVSPVFKNYPGWNCSLDEARSFDRLPGEARAYLEDLEALLGVPFNMISTGPEREKLIVR